MLNFGQCTESFVVQKIAGDRTDSCRLERFLNAWIGKSGNPDDPLGPCSDQQLRQRRPIFPATPRINTSPSIAETASMTSGEGLVIRSIRASSVSSCVRIRLESIVFKVRLPPNQRTSFFT